MKRNKFSLSHYKLLSANMGKLIPVGCVEVLPGDTFQHNTSLLLRCSPLLSPVMHPVSVRLHHWFVPNRIIWDDWEDFITGGPDGADASVYPTITFGGGSGVAIGSLADYLGVPPGVNNIEVSALPFRACAKIWNEFYRDQDLQTELVIDTTSGPDTTTNTTLQSVSWEKDYFTSSRLTPQRGPDVTLSLGTTAPVVSDGTVPNVTGAGATNSDLRGTNITNQRVYASGFSADGTIVWGDNSGLEVDLSSATSITVNALRESLALQRFAERSMRFGNRYVEYLMSAYGVRSSDARLQLPEYLGGGKQTIQFSEVVQSSPGTTSYTGTLRGHGIAAMRSNRYRKFFEEHGYVISFMSVVPKTIYADGLARHWNRRTRYDFFQRELQHIGQQEILNKEVYAAAASPNATFGYQDRYDEYRRQESGIAADFRDDLDMWHFARIFGSEPALNSAFVSSADVPTRPFATTIVDTLQVMAMHRLRARRVVAKHGTSLTF